MTLTVMTGASLDTMTIEMAEDLKETKWLTCVKQLLRVTKVRVVLSINQSILAQQSMRLSTYVMYECMTQIATSVLLTDEPLVVRGVAKNICEQQITSLAQLCLGSYIPRTRSS
jgi:hypothetical protein